MTESRHKIKPLHMSRSLYLGLTELHSHPNSDILPAEYVRQFLAHCQEVEGADYVEVTDLDPKDIQDVEKALAKKSQ